MKELKNCPFCGSEDVRLYRYLEDEDYYTGVDCDGCSAHVEFWAYRSTGKEATEAWNRRIDL